MTLVWRSDLPANHKLVLLAYADHGNDDGTSVYPGEDWMAAKTSYSAGNVRRISRELVAAGFLHRVSPGYFGHRARWEIDVPNLKGAQSAQLAALEAARDRTKRRAVGPKKARGGATPNIINHHESGDVEIADPETCPHAVWGIVGDVAICSACHTEREAADAL